MTGPLSCKTTKGLALMVIAANIINISIAGVAKASPVGFSKMEKVLPTDGYNVSTLFSTLRMSNGKKWVEIKEDAEAEKLGKGFTKFQVILDTTKIAMSDKCKTQAPILVLNVEEIAKKKTRVSVDQSSVFYGQTLEQLFSQNEAKFNAPGFSNSKKNVFAFDVVAPSSMSLFGLTLKLNTNPDDDEDFGSVDLTFSDFTLGLSVYDGDDDSGRSLDIGGINRTQYDNDLPRLSVKCND